MVMNPGNRFIATVGTELPVRGGIGVPVVFLLAFAPNRLQGETNPQGTQPRSLRESHLTPGLFA